MEDEGKAFVLRRKPISSYLSSPALPSEPVELNSFTSCFKWVCVDQSSLWLTGLSWSVFFLFAVAVPLASHFLLQCLSCDANHQRPYHVLVQISLSVFAAISFVYLSRWSHKYGVRKFLFLDKLCDSSDNVRCGYSQQLQRSVKLWTWFVIPCFTVETAYKLRWFISGSTNIPYYGNLYVSDTIICALELFSWLYRNNSYAEAKIVYRQISSHCLHSRSSNVLKNQESNGRTLLTKSPHVLMVYSKCEDFVLDLDHPSEMNVRSLYISSPIKTSGCHERVRSMSNSRNN